MLLKKSKKERFTVPSDPFIPCMSDPFGMSEEMLVRGLVCLKFITPRSDICRINQDEWKAFKETYMLGDLFELEPANLLGGKRQYYVKMGRDCRLNGSRCIDGVKEGSLRMRRRICTGGQKRKVFVDTLMDLIESEWDEEDMEAWLTSDVGQAQHTDKKGDNNESDRETDNSTRTASPKAADSSTVLEIDSPPKAGSDSKSITPNALSNSGLKATLVPSNDFLKQGKTAEKEAFHFLHAFDIPIDNDDTLYGLFRDLQKRLHTSKSSTSDPLPAGGFVCTIHKEGSAEEGDSWNVNYLYALNAEAQERLNNNEDGSMHAVKGLPSWDFIPIERYLFPVLHDLIGLGNNIVEYMFEHLEERWEPQSQELKEVFDLCLYRERQLNTAVKAYKDWQENDAFALEAYAIESKNLTLALTQRCTPDEKEALKLEREKMKETVSELRKGRDKLKLKVKRRRKIFRDVRKAQKEARQNHGRSARRLRAEIEEDVLIPLGIDSSAYHGGALVGNAIRRLMEHAETVAAGVGLKLRACNFKEREQEVKDFTSGIKVVLLLLDAIYSLLLTKYGKVTAQILNDLAELLELLRAQWVKMQLPMTPKFHCLLRHALSQLKSTGGGLCDMGEDGIERSHQERLKDNRRLTGLKNFRRRTDSQTKMQHIRQMVEIQKKQEEVASASSRNLKRDRPLAAETRKEMKKSCREENRARAAQEARDAPPTTEPQATARQLNLADISQGKSIQRAKP
jgi:hypothetical protein